MNHYYVHQPRDFANEYTVYVVEAGSEWEHRLQRIVPAVCRNPVLHHITRHRALWLGKTRPDEAKRTGEQWFGGFAMPGQGRAGWTNDGIAQMLTDAKTGTIEAIREMEEVAAQRAQEQEALEGWLDAPMPAGAEVF